MIYDFVQESVLHLICQSIWQAGPPASLDSEEKLLRQAHKDFECSYFADWKAFAFGEANMWTIAERVVEERLRERSESVVDASIPVDPLS